MTLLPMGNDIATIPAGGTESERRERRRSNRLKNEYRVQAQTDGRLRSDHGERTRNWW